MSGRFRRRGWRSSRFAGRRSFRNGYRSSVRSRARGNARAAQQQADSSDIVINLMTKVKSGLTSYKYNNKVVYPGTVALNVYELLQKSEFFESYSKMYDQFRITSIKVKVTPVAWNLYNQYNIPNAITTQARVATADNQLDEEPEQIQGIYGDVTSTANPEYVDGYGPPDNAHNYIIPQSLTVVTAWDRTGLDESQFLQYKNVDLAYVTNIGDNITTYSSARSHQLVGGATFNCVRYLYPSSQQEKGLYLSTNELVRQVEMERAFYYKYDKAIPAKWGSTYVTNLLSNPNCPFKPTFLLGLISIDELRPDVDVEGANYDEDAVLNKIQPVTFSLEFDIGVSFRGLRKSQVV